MARHEDARAVLVQFEPGARCEHRDASRSTRPALLSIMPSLAPSKIVCVGRNYAAHAKELGNEVPKQPLLFLKPPSSLVRSGESIWLPAVSNRVEHEGEIGVVVGERLRKVSPEAARR